MKRTIIYVSFLRPSYYDKNYGNYDLSNKKQEKFNNNELLLSRIQQEIINIIIKQPNITQSDIAEKLKVSRQSIAANIKELKENNELEKEYKRKSNNLDFDYNNRKEELEKQFYEKEFDFEYKYKHKIKSLEKENTHLRKIVDRFYETVEKFLEWICKKFGIGESKELVRDFERETNTLIDPEKQLNKVERRKEWDLEL